MQIWIDLIVPLSFILIFFTLGFQLLLALLETWLRLMLILLPLDIFLSQMSHFAILTPPNCLTKSLLPL